MLPVGKILDIQVDLFSNWVTETMKDSNQVGKSMREISRMYLIKFRKLYIHTSLWIKNRVAW